MADFVVTNTGIAFLRQTIKSRLPDKYPFDINVTDVLTDTFTVTIDGLSQNQIDAINTFLSTFVGRFIKNDALLSADAKRELILNPNKWEALTNAKKLDALRFCIINGI